VVRGRRPAAAARERLLLANQNRKISSSTSSPATPHIPCRTWLQRCRTSQARKIGYKNLAEAEFKAALPTAGLSLFLATLLWSSHAAIADGVLFDGSRDLSRLIGRPSTAMPVSVSEALSRDLPAKVLEGR